MRTTEQLGPYTLIQQDGLPKIGRDSLLLGRFATVRKGDRVFDLGCGVGVLGLCLAEQAEDLTLDGLDIQPSCVSLAQENLVRNGLMGEIWQGDVTAFRPTFPNRRYDLVISNPPYFQPGRGKTAGGSRGIARTGDENGLLPWCETARRLLRNGGRFALCCRPWDMNALFHHLTSCGLEPKRMQAVQSGTEQRANLILVEAVAQGKPGLELLPAVIMR